MTATESMTTLDFDGLVDVCAPTHAAAVSTLHERSGVLAALALAPHLERLDDPRIREALHRDPALAYSVLVRAEVSYACAAESPGAVLDRVLPAVWRGRHTQAAGGSWPTMRDPSTYPVRGWLAAHVSAGVRPAVGEVRSRLVVRLREALESIAATPNGAGAADRLEQMSFVGLVNERRAGSWNFSTPMLRNVIFIGRRPPWMMAESLLHEAAHQLMYDLLDVQPLAVDPRAVVYSPFVEQDRHIDDVLHGLLSFGHEIVFNEHGSGRRAYVARLRGLVADALGSIADQPLTDDGTQFLRAVTARLHPLPPARRLPRGASR